MSLAALLSACGQKGPLLVPGHSKDTPWPVRTAPAPTSPNPVEGKTPAGAAGADDANDKPAPAEGAPAAPASGPDAR